MIWTTTVSLGPVIDETSNRSLRLQIVVVVEAVDGEVLDVHAVRRISRHLLVGELDEFLGRGRFTRGYPVYGNYPPNYPPYSHYINGPDGMWAEILFGAWSFVRSLF